MGEYMKKSLPGKGQNENFWEVLPHPIFFVNSKRERQESSKNNLGASTLCHLCFFFIVIMILIAAHNLFMCYRFSLERRLNQPLHNQPGDFGRFFGEIETCTLRGRLASRWTPGTRTWAKSSESESCPTSSVYRSWTC